MSPTPNTSDSKATPHLRVEVLRDTLKIIIPSFLAIALFVSSLFFSIIPASRDNLMEQKKSEISHLIQTGWAILNHHHELVNTGIVSIEKAQQMAIDQLRNIRYGPESKDYFWLNDTKPTMIMHPYRLDLEGKDISDYQDTNGKRLFLDVVDIAKKQGEGYVPYTWQLNDNPENISAKLSIVKMFEPWGWVIGTGLYLEDVEREIKAVLKKIVSISIGILLVISLLIFFTVQDGIQEKRKRFHAEETLKDYQDHLESLVESRTQELSSALSKVKQLSGFLPICASCKKIRDDEGYWNQIESYIRTHSEAEFSHSICPDCANTLYPDFNLYQNSKKEKKS